MNRIKLVACPYCKAAVGADCEQAGGGRRHHPKTGKVMFHRARIESAVREVGLVPPKAQPPQLAARRFDFIEAARKLSQAPSVG